MNGDACFYALCLGLLANYDANGRSVAALEASHVIASVRTNKELSCIVQESNPPRIVSWYRTTNVDARKCPNNTYFLNNNNDVFCDRLSNNRILQPGFEQRFSVPAMGSKNQNGLLITMVELSDAGIYACVDHHSSRVRARINLTVEEDFSQKSEKITTFETQDRTLLASTVASTTEFGHATIVLVSASLLSFIAGLVVATTILKSRLVNRTSDQLTIANYQVGMMPRDGANDRQVTSANYCELNTNDFAPTGVYLEFVPPRESAPVLSYENIPALKIPLYNDMVPFMTSTSSGSTTSAYENTTIAVPSVASIPYENSSSAYENISVSQ